MVVAVAWVAAVAAHAWEGWVEATQPFAAQSAAAESVAADVADELESDIAVVLESDIAVVLESDKPADTAAFELQAQAALGANPASSSPSLCPPLPQRTKRKKKMMSWCPASE